MAFSFAAAGGSSEGWKFEMKTNLCYNYYRKREKSPSQIRVKRRKT
jgi:hypothetical protein